MSQVIVYKGLEGKESDGVGYKVPVVGAQSKEEGGTTP